MNHQNKNTKAGDKGFTIVELLIVIVVIGILAAITIVAYNGIQNRARTSSAQATATTVVKKAEAYNALEGSYPTVAQLEAATPQESSLEGTGITLSTTLNADNGTNTVRYQRCDSGQGFNVLHYDYTVSSQPAAQFVTGQQTGCSPTP